MVEQLSKHPALVVRDVLTDGSTGWVPANVDGYDPTVAASDATHLRMSRGWYDGSRDDPQVSLTNFSEGVIGGGVTDVSGAKGDGSGVVQDRDGTGLVTAHAADRDDGYRNGTGAEDLVWKLSQEVERILLDAEAPGDLQYINGSLEALSVDDDRNPPVYQAQVRVSYGYKKD